MCAEKIKPYSSPKPEIVGGSSTENEAARGSTERGKTGEGSRSDGESKEKPNEVKPKTGESNPKSGEGARSTVEKTSN